MRWASLIPAMVMAALILEKTAFGHKWRAQHLCAVPDDVPGHIRFRQRLLYPASQNAGHARGDGDEQLILVLEITVEGTLATLASRATISMVTAELGTLRVGSMPWCVGYRCR